MAKPPKTLPDPDTERWPINDDGLWFELRRAPLSTPGIVLFLDRDGIVIEDRGYVGNPKDVCLIPGAAEMIAATNRKGIPVVIITNQSGIDRGLFGWHEFAAVTARIDALLATKGARIDGIAACPFHPDFTPGYDDRHDRWRKPGPGMITAMANSLNADRAASVMVGDSARDLAAAEAAGLATGILVGDGAPALQDIRVIAAPSVESAFHSSVASLGDG